MALHHMLRAAAQQQAAGQSDPYFEYNTLLLTGDGTNGAQNNTFLDSSTNNFTITRNGNTTQGTFSPYGSLWSNYFDGSGDSIDVPDNAALELGSGDFTIECWIFPTSTNYAAICSKRIAGQTYGSYEFIYNGNTDFSFIASTNNLAWQVAIYSSQPAQLNKWNHVAVTRSGSTWKLWLNGTQVSSDTYSVTVYDQASTLQIGNQQGNVYPFSGYISNFRLVKGTALYNSTFTPSTTPLTAVSGTSLLTCQSNRFIDNSSNNFTLTVNGNTSVQRFSPFNPTAPYSAATIGGSGYFDGSGDYLTPPSNAAFQFGTGAFTVEAWIYPNALSDYAGVVCQVITTGNTQWTFDVFANGKMSFQSWFDVPLETASGVVKIGQWHHVVAVRSGTNSAIFVNGVRVATNASDTKNWSATDGARIGYLGDVNYFNGYISNTRVVKGNAIYDPTQSTITIPTSPLTAVSGTSLLCNFTNAGIPDAAMMNDLETVGNAQVSTSVKKYGTGSLYFDGTGDWLSLPANNNFYFGTGDFTVEFWLYTSVGNQSIVDQWLNGSGSYTTGQWQIGMDASTRYLNFYVATGASAVSSFSTSSAPASGQWVHVAFVRSSNVVKCYIDGTANANTLSFSGTVGVANSKSSIGVQTNNSTLPFQGYIDDLRITKGYARYTANFTPPTAALPTY